MESPDHEKQNKKPNFIQPKTIKRQPSFSNEKIFEPTKLCPMIAPEQISPMPSMQTIDKQATKILKRTRYTTTQLLREMESETKIEVQNIHQRSKISLPCEEQSIITVQNNKKTKSKTLQKIRQQLRWRKYYGKEEIQAKQKVQSHNNHHQQINNLKIMQKQPIVTKGCAGRFYELFSTYLTQLSKQKTHSQPQQIDEETQHLLIHTD